MRIGTRRGECVWPRPRLRWLYTSYTNCFFGERARVRERQWVCGFAEEVKSILVGIMSNHIHKFRYKDGGLFSLFSPFFALS